LKEDPEVSESPLFVFYFLDQVPLELSLRTYGGATSYLSEYFILIGSLLFEYFNSCHSWIGVVALV
jgi:hypothetical protein